MTGEAVGEACPGETEKASTLPGQLHTQGLEALIPRGRNNMYLLVPDPLGILEKLTERAPVQLKDPLRVNPGLSDLQGVKAEFGIPCWNAYNTALENLRFLAGAHDIRQVMSALSQDLGI